MFKAADVMQKRFHSLNPDMTIAEAIQHFKRASGEENKRVFGMIVTDEANRLTGMLSMYDVLFLIRPKHTQIWGIMTDIEVSGLFEVIAERAQSIHVEDLMTTDVITVNPDTHVLHILDIMLRKHIRRLPVVSGNIVQGMVYLSDLFYFLVEQITHEGSRPGE
jgi:predicted transcriptional regulator